MFWNLLLDFEWIFGRVFFSSFFLTDIQENNTKTTPNNRSASEATKKSDVGRSVFFLFFNIRWSKGKRCHTVPENEKW